MATTQTDDTEGDKVTFARWQASRESAKVAVQDVAFLESRLNKLRSAEAETLRSIEATRRQNKALLHAREQALASREVASARQLAILDEQSEKCARNAAERERHAKAVATVQRSLSASKQHRFQEIKEEERALRQAAAAHRVARAARLARRREKIRAVENAATQNHKEWSEQRTRRLQEENLRETADFEARRTAHRERAATLLVDEATLLRRLAELEGRAQSERSKLKDCVLTPRPPRQRQPLIPAPPSRDAARTPRQ